MRVLYSIPNPYNGSKDERPTTKRGRTHKCRSFPSHFQPQCTRVAQKTDAPQRYVSLHPQCCWRTSGWMKSQCTSLQDRMPKEKIDRNVKGYVFCFFLHLQRAAFQQLLPGWVPILKAGRQILWSCQAHTFTQNRRKCNSTVCRKSQFHISKLNLPNLFTFKNKVRYRL